MESNFIYEAGEQSLIIHLPAELDHHNCRNLKLETELLMAENYIVRLIFDFTDTTFMDSSGIGVLLNLYKQIYRNGRIGFYGANPQILRILRIGGVLGFMEAYPSKEAAQKGEEENGNE